MAVLLVRLVSVKLCYDRVVDFAALVGCEMQAGENVFRFLDH
jgi:hypothetical protein